MQIQWPASLEAEQGNKFIGFQSQQRIIELVLEISGAKPWHGPYPRQHEWEAEIRIKGTTLAHLNKTPDLRGFEGISKMTVELLSLPKSQMEIKR